MCQKSRFYQRSRFPFPTYLLALIFLFLFTWNGFSILYVHHLPFPATILSDISPSNLTGEDEMVTTERQSSSAVMYAVKEQDSAIILKSKLPVRRRTNSLVLPRKIPSTKQGRFSRRVIRILNQIYDPLSENFSTKVQNFLYNATCKPLFFMTWISSADSFSDREFLAIESLFKSNLDACLIMVSNSLDSKEGISILGPFLENGFKFVAVKPDFDYIFKNTPAAKWFNQLKEGKIDPGEISLGQNLSNLLRLALLYKFGGVYIDTDVIVLKPFDGLRNVIGAQTMDAETKNWSRLNNAVLVFEKRHPLIHMFIQEFSQTFNGNKWGHNGPYLVSRVVSRASGRAGVSFTVLPPPAFYPVDWSKIRGLFEGPRDELHSQHLQEKLRRIHGESYAVHLWNRESKNIRVEDGSIVYRIMADYCIFCNTSTSSSHSKHKRFS